MSKTFHVIGAHLLSDYSLPMWRDLEYQTTWSLLDPAYRQSTKNLWSSLDEAVVSSIMGRIQRHLQKNRCPLKNLLVKVTKPNAGLQDPCLVATSGRLRHYGDRGRGVLGSNIARVRTDLSVLLRQYFEHLKGNNKHCITELWPFKNRIQATALDLGATVTSAPGYKSAPFQ